MPRRQDHTQEQLRQLAIDSVSRHLRSAPAGQLSLRMVARDIGYSPGTLINLFGSYSLLLLAVNACTLDCIRDQLLQAMDNSRRADAGVIGELEAAAAAYFHYAQENPHAWRLVFELHLDAETPLPAWQSGRISALFTLLEARLLKLKPRATAADCASAARVIWSGVHGICTLLLDNKLFLSDGADARQLIRSLLTHYLTDWCRHTQPPASDL